MTLYVVFVQQLDVFVIHIYIDLPTTSNNQPDFRYVLKKSLGETCGSEWFAQLRSAAFLVGRWHATILAVVMVWNGVQTFRLGAVNEETMRCGVWSRPKAIHCMLRCIKRSQQSSRPLPGDAACKCCVWNSDEPPGTREIELTLRCYFRTVCSCMCVWTHACLQPI